MIIVYETINVVNNKRYVGVHSTQTLNDGYLGSGLLLKRAIKKYGKENFSRKTLHMCEDEELAYFIELLIVNEDFISNELTYNLKIGGIGGGVSKGFKHNKESCKNMSSARIGITFSDEHKLNLRKSQLGTTKSEATKQKMSESKRRMSDDTKRKISQSMMGRKREPYKKSVQQINKENK